MPDHATANVHRSHHNYKGNLKQKASHTPKLMDLSCDHVVAPSVEELFVERMLNGGSALYKVWRWKLESQS